MQNSVNKEQLFCEYYQQWIEVYKRGAIREATMAKYLMTHKWVEKLAPQLKVSELTRTAYQKLLNDYAKQHNLGYEFANSQIITIDSTFLHKTAVKPTLKLLFEEGFEGAEDEIRNAYERRRKGDNKNAILEAGKAFESTMKIICDKQGYAYDKNKDTVQKLITILENNGFYPSYKNAHLTSIRTTLETGLPVVRNKVAGHGQGNQIITIPDEYRVKILTSRTTPSPP